MYDDDDVRHPHNGSKALAQDGEIWHMHWWPSGRLQGKVSWRWGVRCARGTRKHVDPSGAVCVCVCLNFIYVIYKIQASALRHDPAAARQAKLYASCLLLILRDYVMRRSQRGLLIYLNYYLVAIHCHHSRAKRRVNY